MDEYPVVPGVKRGREDQSEPAVKRSRINIINSDIVEYLEIDTILKTVVTQCSDMKLKNAILTNIQYEVNRYNIIYRHIINAVCNDEYMKILLRYLHISFQFSIVRSDEFTPLNFLNAHIISKLKKTRLRLFILV